MWRLLVPRRRVHADVLAYPHVAFVHGSDPPLGVDPQRTLGLLGGDGTHRRGLVRTRHMAGEVTHCRREAERSESDWFDWFDWLDWESLEHGPHLHRCSPGG